MDTITISPPLLFQGDASLDALLDAMAPFGERRLLLFYAGREVRPGFHVTEVKAGSFVTLDCGGNPDSWQETILQVEDLPASQEQPSHMPVGKFLAILDKVRQRVALSGASRVTFEIGRPDEPMQVFDVDRMVVAPDQVGIHLGPRAAVCKPRHRAEQAAAASLCCGPKGCC